jgi:hypothetical protein
MSIDFSALKTRKANSAKRFETFKQEATKEEFSKKEDHRYWQPEVDKAGNGYAVIRFLDSPEGEDNPWVRIWSHGFKNETSGKWYIENSLTTLGQTDPLGELNSRLWATGTEANKEIVRKQKRKLSYISNIVVVSDAKHPENEGKVFLYRYGKKIFDKIKDKMSPPEEFVDEVPMDPFNFWEGANFKLKIRKVEGYRNYDKSEFDAASPLGSDDEIKAVWDQCYSLVKEIDASHFKSYEDLKKNLEAVLNNNGGTGNTTKAINMSLDTEEAIDYEAAAKVTPDKKVKPTAKESKKPATAEGADDLAFFKGLADDEGESVPF